MRAMRRKIINRVREQIALTIVVSKELKQRLQDEKITQETFDGFLVKSQELRQRAELEGLSPIYGEVSRGAGQVAPWGDQGARLNSQQPSKEG